MAAAAAGLYFGLHGTGGTPSATGTTSIGGTSHPSLSTHSSSPTTRSGAATTGTTTNSTATTPAANDAPSCVTGSLIGEGSAAQSAAIEQVAKDYESACPGATVSYTSTDSDSGVTSFSTGQVDFAALDEPLTPAQQSAANQRCAAGGGKAVSIAVSAGAVAITYNIPGVSATSLKLSASTLAKIFTGAVTTWNDQAIVADNPSLTLPNTAIRVFRRADPAGISYDFANYLHQTAPTVFPAAPNTAWPANAGMSVNEASAVAQDLAIIDGSIAYVDQTTAKASALDTVGLNNTALSDTAVSTFVAAARVDTTGGNVIVNPAYANAPANSYPAVSIAYEAICAADNDPSTLPLLKSFLTFLTSPTEQAKLADVGAAALPAQLRTQSAAAFAGLK